MFKVEISSCKRFRMIDTNGNFEGCPYFGHVENVGYKCDAVDSDNPDDKFFFSGEFPWECKFGIDYSWNLP